MNDSNELENKIKELTLLLLYLTSWNDHGPEIILKSWKGYPWDTIDKLCKEGLIYQYNKGNKSVFITEEGIKLAEELKKKFNL